MRLMLGCLLSLVLPAGILGAEVVFEYDPEKKTFPKGVEKLDEQALAQGICITADADVFMADAFQQDLFADLFTHPVRYAVRGEPGRSALLKPIPNVPDPNGKVLLVVRCEGTLTVYLMPDLAAEDADPLGLPDEQAFMDADFNGLESVMTLIKKNVVASRKAGGVPRALVMVRSGTTFGGMVDSLQVLRLAGCEHGIVIVNDEAPSMNIEVKTDPKVEPPIAAAEEVQIHGRILVNIKADGALANADDEDLADEDALRRYIAEEKDKNEAAGLESRLHLRGDEDAVFKHSRRVVRTAAEIGVNQVIFGIFVGEARAPRESDLQLALPGPAREEGDGEAMEVEPLTIKIMGDGRILHGERVLDVDPKKRDLPLLTEVLRLYKDGVDAIGEKPLVQIYAEDDADHQRVIDVLNALAGVKINSVTFTDLSDEKKE